MVEFGDFDSPALPDSADPGLVRDRDWDWVLLHHFPSGLQDPPLLHRLVFVVVARDHL